MAAEHSTTVAEVTALEKSRRDSDIESSGMIFVSSPFNGDNYLVWSRAMKFALGSRMKLSFIDGRSIRPPNGSFELDEWIRKDYLVFIWILNNVSKSIVDAFMYVTSARCLWKLWDELVCLDPLPVCTCTSHRGIVAREASHQLMQFLIGLSSPFANVRSQILVMDPRPDVAKAFSMLLNVQKELQKNRHTKETCFRLHGTPDWYKDLADKKRKGTGRGRGLFAGAVSDVSIQHMKPTDANLSEILRSELKKLLKEDNTSVERPHTQLHMVHINFVEVEEFAGNLTTVPSKSWIVDTRATRHVCADFQSFTHY
ncbi:UNVERIFIED_CONTAM: hypothetical protein Sradi_2092700 [Sesamum radiatum]|uniref:Retrotransposon Copia-like N-terminal domain-containing protein n=1 Tax=Sesamum radiatum TaxID=300843 RepID=A0AAW2TIL3_SESRA